MQNSSVASRGRAQGGMPDAGGDDTSVFQNPRFRLCAHHMSAGQQADEAMPLYNFFVCLNDSRYTKIFSDMERGISDRRDRGLPVLAAIIGVYCLFILFGGFGNGLVMLTVCRNRAMRTARNLFIFNLALSDFILCLFTQPLNLLRLFPDYISWEFGEILCKVVNTLTGLNMFVSTFSITAIALDRFQVIVYPTRTKMERRTMALCLMAIWGAACMMASPLFLFATIEQNRLQYGKPQKICSETTTRIFVKYAKLAYGSGVMVVQYLVPLGIVVAAYARICVRLQHRMRSLKQRGDNRSAYQANREAAEAVRQRRANLLLVTIAVVFSLSWLPLTIVNIVHDFRVLKVKERRQGASDRTSLLGLETSSAGDSTLLISVSQSIPLLLVLVSACLNPVFYGWFNENFQTEFHRVLCLNRLARAGPKFRARVGASGGAGGGASGSARAEIVASGSAGRKPADVGQAIPLIVLESATSAAEGEEATA